MSKHINSTTDMILMDREDFMSSLSVIFSTDYPNYVLNLNEIFTQKVYTEMSYILYVLVEEEEERGIKLEVYNYLEIIHELCQIYLDLYIAIGSNSFNFIEEYIEGSSLPNSIYSENFSANIYNLLVHNSKLDLPEHLINILNSYFLHKEKLSLKESEKHINNLIDLELNKIFNMIKTELDSLITERTSEFVKDIRQKYKRTLNKNYLIAYEELTFNLNSLDSTVTEFILTSNKFHTVEDLERVTTTFISELLLNKTEEMNLNKGDTDE